VDLNTLIDAASGATDAAGRQQAVRAALAGDTTVNLGELETAAAAEFKTLSEPGATGFDSAAVTKMGVLADVVDAIRAEDTERTQTAATVAELTGRVNTPRPAAAPQQPDQPTEPAQPPAPEQPETPAPEQPDTPAPVEPTQPTQPEQPTPPTPPEGAPGVQASGRRPNQVPLATLPTNLPEQRSGSPFAITAAADLPGFTIGSNLKDMDGLTEAVMSRFQQLTRAGGDIRGTRAGIGSIVIDRDPSLVAETQHDWQVIERACNESRLPGGSLLAAGTPGWCAPAEISYEFCPVAVVDGLVDVPSVTARRGSLVWPQSPEFHSIYSGVGWDFTAAQIDEMQTPGSTLEKPCYKITCPDTTSLTLDPTGICIQASILHERAYPELIRYTVDQSMVAYAHRMNAAILRQMAAMATPVDLTTNANLGPGAMSTALEAIELQVEWLRYRHRMGLGATMEMVAPVWMRGILRADLSKRMGNGAELIAVTDQQLTTWLATRGVRIQWVLDWQDSFSDPATTGTPAAPVTIPQSTLFGGGTAPQTAWPTTPQVLIYPAGTYFLARMDIISLEGGLLDSTLLKKNERIVLFVEEAMKVGKRCFQSSLVKIPLCASGQTGSGAWVDCATAPMAAA
jgi:outer membrane biosynthesis protein TonB